MGLHSISTGQSQRQEPDQYVWEEADQYNDTAGVPHSGLGNLPPGASSSGRKATAISVPPLSSALLQWEEKGGRTMTQESVLTPDPLAALHAWSRDRSPRLASSGQHQVGMDMVHGVGGIERCVCRAVQVGHTCSRSASPLEHSGHPISHQANTRVCPRPPQVKRGGCRTTEASPLCLAVTRPWSQTGPPGSSRW